MELAEHVVPVTLREVPSVMLLGWSLADMARTTWKQTERRAARLVGGVRYPANVGGPFDLETPAFVGQVKNVARLSLRELERLAVTLDQLGRKKGKLGCVFVKRSAGRGQVTPMLVVMTEEVWVKLHYGD